MKPKNFFTRLIGITVMLILIVSFTSPAALASSPPGTDYDDLGPSEVNFGSILPVITESGFISLSVDGLGTLAETGNIQVDKPAGATVRSAYLVGASTGLTNRVLADGDVKLDGTDVTWDITTSSSINSWNHWSNVTALVKPKVDAAAAGLVDIEVTEVASLGIDGVILAVIFDDPNETVSNTVVLLFGAQDVLGDTFNISLAEPIDKTDLNLGLDMGLGISYGAQPGGQVSLVDVNGQRLTSSAGGEDDGTHANGALLTVGGIGDSNVNPPPLAPPTTPNDPDDEMYDLLPFVDTGDSLIVVDTINPSNDDNICFAWLFVKSATAIVGEGILLSPATATNQVGETHTVTATVKNDDGDPIEGRTVEFEVETGPHAGTAGSAVTGVDGTATFSYTGSLEGTDTIVASMMDSSGLPQTSNSVTKEWVTDGPGPQPIEVGGDVYPTNKFLLLTPWIALGILLAASGTIIIRRRSTQS